MKTVLSAIVAVVIIGVAAAVAMANPAMLPKHEGYPAKASTSPVTGQSTANDPGQHNSGGDKAIVKSVETTDNHVKQNLMDQNNARIKEKHGAGQLPSVQGPQIKIAPPVTSATKISGEREIK